MFHSKVFKSFFYWRCNIFLIFRGVYLTQLNSTIKRFFYEINIFVTKKDKNIND